jgi:hypothetical protein
MKKSLIAGASVFALVSGFGTSAWADDINVAVGVNVLGQTVTNNATVLGFGDEGMGIAGGAQNSLNNNFGDETYENQVLNQNNINSGINSAQQGGNTAALAVDSDGVGGFNSPLVDFDANLAIAGTWATQDATNTAFVNADDEGAPDDGEDNGIAGDADFSLNNNFGEWTFDEQVLNQNNINSGINSAQQGANTTAIAADLDGSEDNLSVNAAFAGTHLEQEVDNEATNSNGIPFDAGNTDNDAIAGEVNNSLNNEFGTSTFENQVLNQNNINSGINSAQQGANTTAIAASVGNSGVDFGPGDADVSETGEGLPDAVNAVENAIGYDVFGAGVGNGFGDVELFEGNVAAAHSEGDQTVYNDATNSGEGLFLGEQDGGVGGDPTSSLNNHFGDESFRAQVLNQNNINAGINSAQQGANTTAIAADTDGGFFESVLDANVAVATSDQDQHADNDALTEDNDNDGIGGFDSDDGPGNDALHNVFGANTFRDQVLNQNNINAGINSGQQGMNTSAIAYDNSFSLADVNVAWAESYGNQTGENNAEDESNEAVLDITGLGVGGNPKDGTLNNQFGDYTFENQVLNQNSINAGINSFQQGGNTSAMAIADSISFLDVQLAVASTELHQDVDNLARVDSDVGSGGIGGNPQGDADSGLNPLSNEFGTDTFRNQVMNQNNINAGINSAQQGANTTALAVDLGAGGGVDLNGAVSLASLSQTVTNTATAVGANNGGVGGGANYALNNNFGSHTFTNQVMNQNNVNSGINSAQQGSNTVAIAVSGVNPIP